VITAISLVDAHYSQIAKLQRQLSDLETEDVQDMKLHGTPFLHISHLSLSLSSCILRFIAECPSAELAVRRERAAEVSAKTGKHAEEVACPLCS
jgi:hypothetical protein